ncbi:MAG: DUF4398 domain-containing protein [bacterium]|nr:DUF4398 domain-containing protein [Myxococcales bacterium]MCB9543070.1 DUF4398 domain-containing protein [Myxococcales bacterium]MCB9551604.1 DUF4398 domain-containing protein [Myxococcales bacterium]
MTPFRRFRRLAMPAAALSVIAVGCGPVTTTQRVADATVAVEAAQGVDAEQQATFEYVSAVEYLRKAREEEGYSDYQNAIDLAVRAREFAEQAKARALGNRERSADAARATAPTAGPATGGMKP